MPPHFKNLLIFIVGKMEEEEKTPYEIAEVVVLGNRRAREENKGL